MSVSGLSPKHVVIARRMAVQAAALGVMHSPQVHYTQGAQRWQGIRTHRKAWRGEYPTEADCSSYVTWCLWNGLDHFHAHDHVNGLNWSAGYTGTLANHGQQVHANFQPGDLCLYGSGFPYSHVTIYIGGGMVISHGSERGPLKTTMHYRPDLRQIRRFI